MAYGIYVAPSWDGESALPLVVLLHGAGDDERTADQAAVIGALDQAANRGDIPPFVMVTPRGERGFWINWADGSHHYRDWVLEEVVPRVRGEFPVIDGQAGMHLLGVSMGGGGGMQMWLSDPSRFASATIISAPILSEEDIRRFLRRFIPKRILNRAFGPPGSGNGTDPYDALAEPGDLQGSRLTFGAAEKDLGNIAASNAAFHRHLEDHGVPHRYLPFAGKHRWTSWAPVFVDALCHNLQERCPMSRFAQGT